jgi:hypothetical protein
LLLGFFVSANLYFFFGNQLLSVMFFTIFALIKISSLNSTTTDENCQQTAT